MVESPAAAGERKLLPAVAATDLLSSQGIPMVPTNPVPLSAVSPNAWVPVALKVVSSDIIHKSDVGGVRLVLASLSQVSKAYGEILPR